MKAISLAVAGLSLALIALTLVPAAGDYRPYFAGAALLCAAIVLATVAIGWHAGSPVAFTGADADRAGGTGRTDRDTVTPAAGTRPVAPAVNVAPAVHVAAAAAGPNPGEAAVVGFLATLQEKGRLVDFLQDDITSYSDAQVGAAARVVHQGCQAVLREYVRIVPVRDEREGATVTVDAGYAADEYRLVGKISGQPPFAGTLVHRGWKADSVQLPRAVQAGDSRLPTIAPAEVELR